MDFDPDLVAVLLAPAELRGELSRVAQWQHLLDFHADGHRLRRQAEGFAGRRKRDLTKTGAGHDRLAVHLVVEQVSDEFRLTSAVKTWSRPYGSSTCVPSSGWALAACRVAENGAAQ